MAGKSKKVIVQATRNLDFLDQDQYLEVERDDRINGLIDGGYLIETELPDSEEARELPQEEVETVSLDDTADAKPATRRSRRTASAEADNQS